jgi:hypothetical protein
MGWEDVDSMGWEDVGIMYNILWKKYSKGIMVSA